jgi:hypothetical protein
MIGLWPKSDIEGRKVCRTLDVPLMVCGTLEAFERLLY